LYSVDGAVQNKGVSLSSLKKKTGKKPKQTLRPSFVNLVKGVCEIFQEQTGKKPNLENVCASFFNFD
jgi:hypothetical protein